MDANSQLLGTLQVDSDLTVEQAGFNKPEAAELMQQFADVLSLMMIGIPVQLGDCRDPRRHGDVAFPRAERDAGRGGHLRRELVDVDLPDFENRKLAWASTNRPSKQGDRE